MNKQELLSTYTPEQLAEMLIKTNNLLDMLKYSDSYLKTGLFDNPAVAALEARLNIAQNRIKNLEEGNGRLQAKLDTYNEYLLPRCTEEARRMIDKNRFAEVRIVTWDEWNNRGKDSMNISGIQNCQEEYEKLLKESPIQGIVDGITKDILKQKNNAMAMEFTKAICGLLEKYGVRINCTETKHQNITHNLIEEKYGIMFDSVDFSKHDKEFTDKIEELKKQLDRSQTTINQIDEILEELFGVTHDVEKPGEFKEILREKVNERISDFLPTEPIKIADMLIDNATAVYENYVEDFAKAYSGQLVIGNPCEDVRQQTLSYLRQIAKHLLVYCNHNEGGEE